MTGLNHNTAPVEVREELAFDPDEIHPVLRQLDREDLIREGVLLSTCNRTELYMLPGSSLTETVDAMRVLCDYREVELEDIEATNYDTESRLSSHIPDSITNNRIYLQGDEFRLEVPVSNNHDNDDFVQLLGYLREIAGARPRAAPLERDASGFTIGGIERDQPDEQDIRAVLDELPPEAMDEADVDGWISVKPRRSVMRSHRTPISCSSTVARGNSRLPGRPSRRQDGTSPRSAWRRPRNVSSRPIGRTTGLKTHHSCNCSSASATRPTALRSSITRSSGTTSRRRSTTCRGSALKFASGCWGGSAASRGCGRRRCRNYATSQVSATRPRKRYDGSFDVGFRSILPT